MEAFLRSPLINFASQVKDQAQIRFFFNLITINDLLLIIGRLPPMKASRARMKIRSIHDLFSLGGVFFFAGLMSLG